MTTVTTEQLQFVLSRANILIVEDTPEHRTEAEVILAGLQGPSPLFDRQTIISFVEDCPIDQQISEFAHAVVTDIMIDGQPEGLATAIKAYAEGVPCVVVTSGVSDSGGHLPRYVTMGLMALSKLGIPIFYGSGAGQPKPWKEAFEKVAELILEKWLKEDSPIVGAIRRKYQSSKVI